MAAYQAGVGSTARLNKSEGSRHFIHKLIKCHLTRSNILTKMLKVPECSA